MSMTPEMRWLFVMFLSVTGFLASQYGPFEPSLRSRLDASSRTAFATVLLRNAPTVVAVHGYGSANAMFSTWLGIGYMGAGLIPLNVDEDKAPLVSIYFTVLNISMTCWCFGLFMGIAKLGIGCGFGKDKPVNVSGLLRLGVLTLRGVVFFALMLTQWRLSTVHPPSKSLKVTMVMLQLTAVASTFIETHTLSDNLSRHVVSHESDLMIDISTE